MPVFENPSFSVNQQKPSDLNKGEIVNSQLNQSEVNPCTFVSNVTPQQPLLAGNPVKLTVSGSQMNQIEEAVAQTDTIYGFSVYTVIKGSTVSGGKIGVVRTGQVRLEANGPIPQGTILMVADSATPTTAGSTQVAPYVSGTAGTYKIGTALTSASAAGDIITVQLDIALVN